MLERKRFDFMDDHKKALSVCHRWGILFGLFWVYLMSAPVESGWAGDRALQELIDLLQKNGVISTEQALTIQETIDSDRKRLEEKERQLQEREADVGAREEALAEREKVREAITASVPPVEDQAMVPLDEETPYGVEEPGPGIGPLKVSYKDGFGVASQDDRYSLHVGSVLQGDYRDFYYSGGLDAAKNRFDIRRARLIVHGQLSERFRYRFQYEFQGSGSRRLLDAYMDVRILPFINLRGGQFKEPFSLEQFTRDQNTPFAERSMGFYLTPGRDVGIMAHASLLDDQVWYGIGVFNGDGPDDTVGGDVDTPEFTGRLALTPFKKSRWSGLQGLHVGGSISYARADRNNVAMDIKTAGLTTFFNVASRAKFNVIRDVKSRTRYAAEVACTWGPLMIWGEYVNLKFTDVQTSSSRFDVDSQNIYGAILWMITGEQPEIRNGVIQPIRPRKNVWEGGWGAVGLAFRYDSFDAGKNVYQELVEPGVSVRKANSITLALNWYLNPYIRLLIDATRTDFDRALLIFRDSLTSRAEFSARESVITGRFQLQF